MSTTWHGLGEGRMLRYRMLVLVTTFFTYASFHMSRKAPSIVKGALHPHVESSNVKTAWNPISNPGWLPFSADLNPEQVEIHGYDINLSEVCEVNSNQGAGTYTCLNHSHKIATNYYNLSYCSNYGSKVNIKRNTSEIFRYFSLIFCIYLYQGSYFHSLTLSSTQPRTTPCTIVPT